MRCLAIPTKCCHAAINTRIKQSYEFINLPKILYFILNEFVYISNVELNYN